MYRDVLTCEECECYKLEAKCSDQSDIYRCIHWDRIVEASDYCSKAVKAYPCRSCKYCRLLTGRKDRYLCVREHVAYYTALDYSCSYHEKGEELNNESKNNQSI